MIPVPFIRECQIALSRLEYGVLLTMRDRRVLDWLVGSLEESEHAVIANTEPGQERREYTLYR